MVQEMVKKVKLIRQKMKAAKDRQKSYADLHSRFVEFKLGDKVLLKVSPKKGVMRFGKKGKLSQKHIGPDQILDRVSEVAYRLALPPALDRLNETLTYVETPKEILDRKVRKTRNGETALLNMLWSNHNVEEATWEAEEAMRQRYPHLFLSGTEAMTNNSAVTIIDKIVGESFSRNSYRDNVLPGKDLQGDLTQNK
ncbi:uncharacterized protein LOC141630347 [Silene latifolia]|uniref:uncharacterized protein LOC141630347 n=1 Tax=Silene latifolia TaxID=37657 RepID=UPI003D78A61D